MSLPGLDGVKPPFKPATIDSQFGQAACYNLFLAIFPSSGDAQRIAAVAADLRQRHHLGDKCLRVDGLHITLHVLANRQSIVPQEMVDAALAAAAGVACSSLPVVFDHAGSFHSRAKKKPFVLRCDAAGDTAIARLRQPLQMALRRAGLRPNPSTTPHMTMLYDRRAVPEHPIEPMRWTATRFALILSHVGLEHHEWIGCWPLGNGS